MQTTLKLCNISKELLAFMAIHAPGIRTIIMLKIYNRLKAITKNNWPVSGKTLKVITYSMYSLTKKIAA